MQPRQIVLRSLTYYWRTNVAVVLGVATAVSVLAGALLVGDSVRGSLRDLQRFLAAFDNKHTVGIEARLKSLTAPTLIVWGTDDVYFDVKWSRWLADTIPGTRRRVELENARIFFPEERWAELNQELRAHWQAAPPTAR